MGARGKDGKIKIQDGRRKRSERGRRWSPLTAFGSVINFKSGFEDGQTPTSRKLEPAEWMAGTFPTDRGLIIGG